MRFAYLRTFRVHIVAVVMGGMLWGQPPAVGTLVPEMPDTSYSRLSRLDTAGMMRPNPGPCPPDCGHPISLDGIRSLSQLLIVVRPKRTATLKELTIVLVPAKGKPVLQTDSACQGCGTELSSKEKHYLFRFNDKALSAFERARKGARLYLRISPAEAFEVYSAVAKNTAAKD